MLLPILGVIAGLTLLTYAADQFVIGAARLATKLRLSAVVIGAVVIGFGTSAPELVVSGLAANQGLVDVGIGNIVGSNIANLSLVLGAAALVTTLVVDSPVIRRELPISTGAVLLFALFVQNGFTWVEGAILLAALVAALAYILISSHGEADALLTADVEGFVSDGTSIRAGFESLRTLLGLVFTVAAAQILIVSATSIAEQIGLNEGFVGLTIVAIGTSLPELATSMQAARKGDTDLIVGNLLGSNMFNSLAVGGVVAVVGPASIPGAQLTGLATIMMITAALATALFMLTKGRIGRTEGIILLAGYVVMMPLLA